MSYRSLHCKHFGFFDEPRGFVHLKLHANTELLETIKDALFYYAERIADIQKEVRELDELVKNPTRA